MKASATAAKGRYFPIELPVVKAHVRSVRLEASWPEGKALWVVLANPRPTKQREHTVAEFRPGSYLSLFSVPLEIDPAEGVQLWQRIIELCAGLDSLPVPQRSGVGPIYVFLDELVAGRIAPRVVARWYHYQTHKYRSTDKFTGGLKRKLLRVEEYPVESPADEK